MTELNKWESILNGIGFDPKYYDKVTTYINTHILVENMEVLNTNNIKTSSSLSIALNVINKLNNLDKVVFITSPSEDISGETYETDTIVLTTPVEISDVDKECISLNTIIGLEKQNIIQLVDHLNELLVDHKLYIFMLYSESNIRLNEDDNTVDFQTKHRFFKRGV